MDVHLQPMNAESTGLSEEDFVDEFRVVGQKAQNHSKVLLHLICIYDSVPRITICEAEELISLRSLYLPSRIASGSKNLLGRR